MTQLFDHKGRFIPAPIGNMEDKDVVVCESNENYYLVQPEINYRDRLNCLHEFLVDTNFTAEQFQLQAEELKKKALADERIANIFNGIHLPIIIPYNSAIYANATAISNLILKNWLKAAFRSFKYHFSHRDFSFSVSSAYLYEHIEIFNKSRYVLVLEKMNKGAMVGWYFPNPFQGFSVSTQLRYASKLPDNLFLSGLDTIIGQIMYPDVLFRDSNVPNYDLAPFFYPSMETMTPHIFTDAFHQADPDIGQNAVYFGVNCSSDYHSNIDNISGGLLLV